MKKQLELKSGELHQMQNRCKLDISLRHLCNVETTHQGIAKPRIWEALV